MPNTDGSVVVSVDMSVDEAEKELARLKKKIIQAESSLSETKYKKSALQKEFEEAEAAYEKLYQTAKRDSRGEWLPADAAALEAAEKKANDLREKMNKVDEAIHDGTLSLDAMKNRYGEVAENAQKASEAAAEAQKASEAAAEAQKASEAAAEAQKASEAAAEAQKASEAAAEAQKASEAKSDESRFAQVKEDVQTVVSNFAAGLKQIPGAALDLVKRGISSVASGIKTAFSKGLQFVKAFGNGIASVAKGIVGVAKGITGFVSKLNVFKSISDALSGTFSRLGTMIKRAFVFNIVTRGLNLLRDTIGTYLTQNTALMNAVGQLKSAFLTAFQPIYDAVVPILTTIINLVTRAVSAVASFIATLFGTTARQAQNTAKQVNAGTKALEGESGALKDTAEAAEEAEGSLAGFDEINTITTENAEKAGDGGGGGGSAGGLDDAAALFDLDYEDTVFDSWGEAFSAMLDKMLGAMPKVRAALLSFADSLNEISQKVLDMFTFPGVKEKVVQLGADLANAFNDLVVAIDWNLLGQALGAGLNLALLFLVNLVYTFDWLALGQSLADSLNGLVSQIDWAAFGELLWAGFKIGIEMLAGFLLGLDMTQIALAGSNLILGFVQSVSDTIQSINWKKLADQIVTFFREFKWKETAESARNFVQTFFNALTDFLTEGLPDLLQTVAELVPLMVDTLIDSVGMFVDAALEIITALADGILRAIPTLIAALPRVIDSLINGFLEAIPKIIQTGVQLLTSLTENLPEIISSIVHAIPEIIQGIIQAISENVPQIIQAGFDLLTALVTDLPQILMEIVGAIPDIISGIVDALLQGIPVLFDVGAQFVMGLWDGICSLAGWLWDQLGAWVNDIWNSVVGFFTGKSSSGSSSQSTSTSKATRSISYAPMSALPTNIELPRLAQGAVIPPNREFMAVLGDQRNGNNLEAPESLIRSIVNERNDQIIERLDRLISGTESLISVTRSGKALYVDKKVLAKTAADGINEMTRMSGKPVLLV